MNFDQSEKVDKLKKVDEITEYLEKNTDEVGFEIHPNQ